MVQWQCLTCPLGWLSRLGAGCGGTAPMTVNGGGFCAETTGGMKVGVDCEMRGAGGAVWLPTSGAVTWLVDFGAANTVTSCTVGLCSLTSSDIDVDFRGIGSPRWRKKSTLNLLQEVSYLLENLETSRQRIVEIKLFFVLGWYIYSRITDKQFTLIGCDSTL